MGFLELGVPMNWEDTKKVAKQIKKDGLDQLLHTYHANKHREDTDLKWGDEIEYTLVHFDHERKAARLCIDGPAILEELEEREKSGNWSDAQGLGRTAAVLSGARLPFLRSTVWHPEFGRHMVEATPNPPYDFSVNSLLEIEDSMLSRRYKLQSVLPQNTFVTSLTAFPRLGLPDTLHTRDAAVMEKLAARGVESCGDSSFFPDELITPHPRFPTLVRNVVSRRGVKTCQLVKIFTDNHSGDSSVWEDSLEIPVAANPSLARRLIAERSLGTRNPVRDHIYMDHFGFGMGMSCLQMTFGAPDLESARVLYDQMAVLAPIFLALSAATPILRGFLADTDTRWRVLEQGCDCRSDEELPRLARTRYGAVSLYIGRDEHMKRDGLLLNDLELPIDRPSLEHLNRAGMDELLACHFASLWVRDPLVVFSDKIKLDNRTHSDHFENIQSTNWNSVRFKPPPVSVDSKHLPAIGWRVELRTCDLQLSDFENAAIAGISNLLAMAIVKQGWRFYIPISQTHANLDTAHKRDVMKHGLFYFRTQIEPTNDQLLPPLSQVVSKMSMREIFLGSNRVGFKGLIPMLDNFVSNEWRNQRCSRDAVEKYRIYTNYLRSRVRGQVPNDATVLRHLVLSHPNYEGDSQVPEPVAYDICKTAVLSGFSLCPETSCWGVPGCMPVSALKSSTLLPPALSSIANVPLVTSLLSLPHMPDLKTKISQLLESNQPPQDRASSCRGDACDEALRLTPQENDFDRDLFLQMDEHSR